MDDKGPAALGELALVASPDLPLQPLRSPLSAQTSVTVSDPDLETSLVGTCSVSDEVPLVHDLMLDQEADLACLCGWQGWGNFPS